MTYGLLWSTGEHGEDDDGDDEHNDDDDDDTHECRWTICPDSTDARRAALHRLIQNPPSFNINHNFSSQSPRSIANSIKMMLQT